MRKSVTNARVRETGRRRGPTWRAAFVRAMLWIELHITSCVCITCLVDVHVVDLSEKYMYVCKEVIRTVRR